ncbi:MAG: polymer-forming cytoskeletal protein [Candidatus Acidiferrum sp.]
MWSSKRPEAPQTANVEPKNLQTSQPRKTPPATLEQTGRLGPDLKVKGEISGSEDLLIDGLVEGSIELAGRKLTIGTTAKVTADIVAGEVVVGGHLKGNVSAKQRVQVKKDGSVTGDLTTAQIVIEDGAYFKGSIEIEKSGEKESDPHISSSTPQS